MRKRENMRRLRSKIAIGALSTVVGLSGVAFANRPIYRNEPSLKEKQTIHTARGAVVSAKEDEEFRRTGLYSPRTSDEPLVLKICRWFTVNSVIGLSRFFMEVLNDTKIVGNEENYDRLKRLIDECKDRRRGMITVSNHTSVFDDPVLQSCVTKFMLNPDKMRWGICKESICFGNEAIASFTGAGKVLPIKVGAGLEQMAFKAVGRRLAEGEWVHIYPEAGCIQSGTLGQGQFVGCRDPEKAKRIGLLKWGVGKLAARTAFQETRLPPIIIPYYHVGMNQIKPQFNLPHSNHLVDPWYVPGRIGKKVRVIVGDPIEIQDLIDEYEKKTGKPRRIAHVLEDSTFEDWDGSTQAELELYSKITKRVEDALLRLEAQVNIEYNKK